MTAVETNGNHEANGGSAVALTPLEDKIIRQVEVCFIPLDVA
jgi:hypothetical protein